VQARGVSVDRKLRTISGASLDVLEDQGMGLTSDVIAACDWIVKNKAKYNIKVANFSIQSSAPADTAAWQKEALKDPNWDAPTRKSKAWNSASWDSASWDSASWGSASWGSATMADVTPDSP
jgi:hypothetical protein